jgi:cell division protein FtsW
LPWISWGGTSQIFTAIIFGFLLTISAENQAELVKQDSAVTTDEEDYPEEEIVYPNFEN